jgi:hypothetical protein
VRVVLIDWWLIILECVGWCLFDVVVLVHRYGQDGRIAASEIILHLWKCGLLYCSLYKTTHISGKNRYRRSDCVGMELERTACLERNFVESAMITAETMCCVVETFRVESTAEIVLYRAVHNWPLFCGQVETATLEIQTG